MAEEANIPVTDTSMIDDDTQLPPIDNIHNIPADAPAPQASFDPIPPVVQAGVAVPDIAQPLPQAEPFANNNVPTAARSTPNRAVNGTPEVSAPLPSKAASHGDPARRYLNDKVTGYLLEGMKKVVLEQPEDPLRVLGEFLLQKSKEVESVGPS